MHLIEVEARTSPDHIRLIGHVERDSQSKSVVWAINESEFKESTGNKKEAEIYFEFPKKYESFISLNADAFAIAMLLPSMAAGEPLEIDLPVSELLLFNLTGIQEIFHTWHRQFLRVPVYAKPRVEPHKPKPRVPHAGSFFSGGVDSFYTLLKRLGPEPLPVPLTHMIFMHGVEQKLTVDGASESSHERAEIIASKIGIECIVGKTNLRTLFPLHWERYYVGTALAATAVALSEGLSYVCIPSSFTHLHQDFPIPHGTTPLVDERYSTEDIRVVHDGAEASRAEKTVRITEWNRSLVLENLRVCMDNGGAAFNCGKCYKCVRTGVALKLIGLWDEAAVFPNKTTSHWGDVIYNDHLVFTEENLELARDRGIKSELTEQLETIVRKLNRNDGLAMVSKNSALELLLPVYRKIRLWLAESQSTH